MSRSSSRSMPLERVRDWYAEAIGLPPATTNSRQALAETSTSSRAHTPDFVAHTWLRSAMCARFEQDVGGLPRRGRTEPGLLIARAPGRGMARAVFRDTCVPASPADTTDSATLLLGHRRRGLFGPPVLRWLGMIREFTRATGSRGTSHRSCGVSYLCCYGFSVQYGRRARLFRDSLLRRHRRRLRVRGAAASDGRHQAQQEHQGARRRPRLGLCHAFGSTSPVAIKHPRK